MVQEIHNKDARPLGNTSSLSKRVKVAGVSTTQRLARTSLDERVSEPPSGTDTHSHILCDVRHGLNSLSAIGQLNGKVCNFIIDTGASLSIINPNRLNQNDRVVDSPIKLASVTGEDIPVHGAAKVVIRFGNWKTHHTAIVAPIELDCILGVDFLLQNRCKLDFAENVLFSGDHCVHLFFPRDVRCGLVVNQYEEVLPPRSEVLLTMTNPLYGVDGTLLADTVAGLPAGVSLGPTLCEGESQTLTLRLRNLGTESVRIPQGYTVASIESVEILDRTVENSVLDSPLSTDSFDVYDGLSEGQRLSLNNLLHEFRHIFGRTATDVGRTELTTHSIDTQGAGPIKVPPRRLPLAKLEEARRLVRDMSDRDVIRPSQSPWAAPVVLVKKKDGSLRFCVDYRRLNDATKKDAYPLPRMDSILSSMGDSKWFSTLDLQSGYWQVAMNPDDREKTAFVVDRGLWEFNVMPFGLCNAPATFERLMDRVFADVPWQTALVYLDDIIVHGKDFDDHVANLRVVFQKLAAAGLKLSPSKCHLFKQSVKYLGHIVSKDGLSADPEKCRVIREWPVPNSKTQVRSFLGLCSYYRKFVADFSTVAKPLSELTEKLRPFSWSESAQTAFDTLKCHLTSPPILAFPRDDGEFVLDTDASHAGIGAVLNQIQGGCEHVLEFYSSSFSPAEKNYCVTRQEMLAVVKAVKHFRHYLFGRPFRLRTDHSSLRWLASFKEPEGQLARWLEILGQYDFVIEHRPGARHMNADALSRRPCIDCKHCARLESRELQVNLTSVEGVCWRTEQAGDPNLLWLIEYLSKGGKPSRMDIMDKNPEIKTFWSHWDEFFLTDGILYHRHACKGLELSQVVIPQNFKRVLLEEFHSSRTGGHLGVAKTYKKLRQRYFWNLQHRDVELFVKNCEKCRARSGPRRRLRGELQTYVVGAPFERIGIDVLGPLPKSDSGNRFITIVMDYFTKWPEGFATPDQTAETVANGLVENVISRFGVPYQIHSDQGRNFESNVFRAVLDRLGVEKTRTTPLHPQSDGMVERFNRTLLDYLAKFVDANQKNWDKLLPLALLAYRAAEHESTGYTPALLNLGRELRLPVDLLFGSPPNRPNSNDSEYVDRFIEGMKLTHQLARDHLRIASEKMKAQYDLRSNPRIFSPGDKVWFFNPVRRKGFSPKLQIDWEGPCEVTECLSQVVYKVRVPGKRNDIVIHVDRLAPYTINEDNA